MMPVLRSILATLAMLALALAVLVPSTAQAACRQWNLDGTWTFVQSNGTPATIQIQQSGSELRGKAYFVQYLEASGFEVEFSGPLDGTIDGDRFEFTVVWSGGEIGIYNGVIRPDGSMEGGTRDKRNPDTYATWTSDRNASCKVGFDRLSAGGLSTTPTAGTPRGADGRPAVALGRVKTPAPVAACPGWNVSTITGLSQTNTILPMYWEVKQEGSSFKGFASYFYDDGGSPIPSLVEGTIQGSVSGNAINFTAKWNNGTAGIYTGSINSAGRVEGTSYQQGNPAEHAEWNAQDLASCSKASGSEANGAEKTGLYLGRVQATGPAQPVPSICDAARSARARNSPAAPGLEARCQKLGETSNMPVSNLVDQAELDRLATIGSAIARTDYSVGNMRRSSADPAWRFGFDVGTALFGDPSLGAQGKKSQDALSINIRASLDPVAQPGFDESVTFHLSRNYAP